MAAAPTELQKRTSRVKNLYKLSLHTLAGDLSRQDSPILTRFEWETAGSRNLTHLIEGKGTSCGGPENKQPPPPSSTR